MTHHLHIDIETYSSEDIGVSGLYRYALAPDFAVLLVALAWDDAPTGIIDVACGEELPEDFLKALTDPSIVKHAHNAAFERVCLSVVLRRLGRIDCCDWLDPSQWHCSMIAAARCGLPLSLRYCGEALGLEQRKLAVGRVLISRFCSPHEGDPLSLYGGRKRVMPSDCPDDWRTFKTYCIRDVDVEREVDHLTSWYPVTEPENDAYSCDQHINDRGVRIDYDLVTKASKGRALVDARTTIELRNITGLDNPNSVMQLKRWIESRIGQSLPSFNKKDVAALLEDCKDPDIVKVLRCRQQAGKTSLAKYDAMLSSVCADGRIRGLTQFYGSRTGRWAGRLVQMQNLPQNHLADDELTLARTILVADGAAYLDLVFGNTADILSQLIRTAFIAAPNYTLAVCDYNAIEARVLAWMAGEEWVLDAFRSGEDIYCTTASRMFGVPVEKHGRNAELRQKGKIAVLALGYGGGQGALDKMGGQALGMTPEEERTTVRKWREANANIVSFWGLVEKAAVSAVGGNATRVGAFTFSRQPNGTLTVELPSGRLLSYPEATLVPGHYGGWTIKFKGTDQESGRWQWVETFGGKLTENLTQAVARDCLAEAIRAAEHAHIQVVFHVHDEIIAEVPAISAKQKLEEIKDLFSRTPEWAVGLPLKGAGYLTNFYKKD